MGFLPTRFKVPSLEPRPGRPFPGRRAPYTARPLGEHAPRFFCWRESRVPLRELRSLTLRGAPSRDHPCAACGAPLEPRPGRPLREPCSLIFRCGPSRAHPFAARGEPLAGARRTRRALSGSMHRGEFSEIESEHCLSAPSVAAPPDEKSPTHPAGVNTPAHWLPWTAARVPARSAPGATREWRWLAH